MNNHIQKIIEDFDFNSIHDNNKGKTFAENILGVVDLSLPSGLLWCECNLGANFEYEYGDYYAWGELTTKSEYTEKTYAYIDNPKQLPPKFDIATQTLGKNYCIPTKEQFDELIKYTKNKWVVNYRGTGINGQVFTGSNGNTMFIPAAGYRDGTDLNDIGTDGYVWSSNSYAYSVLRVWYLDFSSDDIYVDYDNRYQGLTVRPVFKK